MPEHKLRAVQARRGQHAALMANLMKGLDEEQQRKLLAAISVDITAMFALLPPEPDKPMPGAPGKEQEP